jgi:hypothetical protein
VRASRGRIQSAQKGKAALVASESFDDRVARIQEYLSEPTSDDLFRDAERASAAGEDVWALLALELAKIRRDLEQLRN